MEDTHKMKDNYWILIKYEDICSGNGGVIRLYLKSLNSSPTDNGVRIRRKMNFTIENALTFKSENKFYDYTLIPGAKLPANLVKFKHEAIGAYGIIDGIDWIRSKTDRQLEGYFRERLGFSWQAYIGLCRRIANN